MMIRLFTNHPLPSQAFFLVYALGCLSVHHNQVTILLTNLLTNLLVHHNQVTN